MKEAPVSEGGERLFSSWHWFFEGIRGLVSVPAFILMMSFLGFGGLAAEAGLTTAEAMFLALSTWALPSAVLVVGSVLNDVPFYATVFAVALAAVRFMPMSMALLPHLRTETTKTWHLIVASSFIAITAWVIAMNTVEKIPKQGRMPFFLGLGASLSVVNTLVTGVSHVTSTALPPVAAAALLFLTPVYFLISMTQSARMHSDYIAIGLGLLLGPLFHLITPETDLLWCGVVGGTVAYGCGQMLERSGKGGD